MLTREQVTDLIEFVTGNLPGYQDKDLVSAAKAWMVVLQDLPYELVKAAVIKWAANNTESRFPPPGLIRETAIGLIPSPKNLPLPEEAWIEVYENVKECGRYKTPVWSHPEIQEAARAVGWLNLCCSECIGVERAHFFRIYEVLRNRKIEEFKDESLKKLALETKGRLLLE